MIYMTIDCLCLTQSSVIRAIYLNVNLKCFFHLSQFLLLSLVFTDIYILRDNVQPHLGCGGIYNNSGMWSRSRRLGLETVSRHVNVSSRSHLGLGAICLGLGPVGLSRRRRAPCIL